MEDVDRLAELESIAQQFAARLRDDDPEAVGRWLCAVTTPEERGWQLLWMLGMAVPTDRTWSQLTAWCVLEPCGTWAAAKRHRYHGERLDDACRAAERARNNANNALRRQGSVAA